MSTVINTSEKTVEVNVLHELANCIERATGRQVTIVSPTPFQENFLGYDDMLEGLGPGTIIALQFKRPFTKDPDHANFIISRDQYLTLSDLFDVNQAFYVFAPFPTIGEFIRIRPNLLQSTIIVDVTNTDLQNMLGAHKRMIRIIKTPIPEVRIIDRPTYHLINGYATANSLCPSSSRVGIGRHSSKFINKDKFYLEKENKNISHILRYYLGKITNIHISDTVESRNYSSDQTNNS